MNELSITVKLIITSIFLLMFAISAFLGWRVLRLIERVKNIQTNRNEIDEVRRKQSDALRQKGIAIDKIKKEKPTLNLLEKKMILASLNMSQYKAAIQDSKTKLAVKKTYADLKKKIKESIND